jgi:predicted metal-dependent hydrolase
MGFDEGLGLYKYDSYDAVMDRLAALAVQAVGSPAVAVQAYWLGVLCAELCDMPGTPLTIDQLRRRAEARPPLPEWAQTYAGNSWQQLIDSGIWLDSNNSTRLPLHPVITDDVWHTCGGMERRLCPSTRLYAADIREEMQRLWQAALWRYGVHPAGWQEVPGEVLSGAVLFEAGLFFACHEYFETLWGRTGDPASDFYQGLIQIAVAMRHLESHNRRGARILLQAGTERLRRYPAVYKGLALGPFLEQLEQTKQDLSQASEAWVWGGAPRLLSHAEWSATDAF